jgi:hypothetical protein
MAAYTSPVTQQGSHIVSGNTNLPMLQRPNSSNSISNTNTLRSTTSAYGSFQPPSVNVGSNNSDSSAEPSPFKAVSAISTNMQSTSSVPPPFLSSPVPSPDLGGSRYAQTIGTSIQSATTSYPSPLGHGTMPPTSGPPIVGPPPSFMTPNSSLAQPSSRPKPKYNPVADGFITTAGDKAAGARYGNTTGSNSIRMDALIASYSSATPTGSSGNAPPIMSSAYGGTQQQHIQQNNSSLPHFDQPVQSFAPANYGPPSIMNHSSMPPINVPITQWSQQQQPPQQQAPTTYTNYGPK